MTILYLGKTPLHRGAPTGQFEIIKYLVDHSATVNIKNREGE